MYTWLVYFVKETYNCRVKLELKDLFPSHDSHLTTLHAGDGILYVFKFHKSLPHPGHHGYVAGEAE